MAKFRDECSVAVPVEPPKKTKAAEKEGEKEGEKKEGEDNNNDGEKKDEEKKDKDEKEVIKTIDKLTSIKYINATWKYNILLISCFFKDLMATDLPVCV